MGEDAAGQGAQERASEDVGTQKLDYADGVITVDSQDSTTVRLLWQNGEIMAADEVRRLMVEPVAEATGKQLAQETEIVAGGGRGYRYLLRSPGASFDSMAVSTWACGKRTFTMSVISAIDPGGMKLEIKVALLTLGTLLLAASIYGSAVLAGMMAQGGAGTLVAAAGVVAAVGYGGWKAVTRWLPAGLERDAPPARLPTDRPSWFLVAGPVVFAGVVTIAVEVLQAKGVGKVFQAWGLIFAIVYNGVPGHVRRRKYLVLFSTMLCNERVTGAWLLMLLAFVVVSVVAAAVTRARDARTLTPGVRAIFRLSMRASNERARVIVIVLAAILVGLQYLLLDTYRLNRSVDLLERADFVSFLLDLVLGAFGLAVVLRYYTKDAAARRPILFLRSFSDASVPARLKTILGPITKSAVIRCLVHPSQRASALQQRLPPSQFLSSEYATEDGWQSWVQAQLASCAGAVFDFCSLPPGGGTGVRWEYEHAVATLPPERIAVLVSDDTADSFSAANVQKIHLRQDAQLARESLSRWADRVTAAQA